jgi:hypothetical protein
LEVKVRRRVYLAVLSIIPPLLLSACNDGDYLAVAGGGFLFNYRNAEATYGVALKPMRDLPEHATIEASFENPAGGAPIVLKQEGPFNPTRIAYDTPPIQGVVAGKPYKVSVILKDDKGAVLQTIAKSFQSDLDQSVLPQKPLVIGPGYQKNIDASASSWPPSINLPPDATKNEESPPR